MTTNTPNGDIIPYAEEDNKKKKSTSSTADDKTTTTTTTTNGKTTPPTTNNGKSSPDADQQQQQNEEKKPLLDNKNLETIHNAVHDELQNRTSTGAAATAANSARPFDRRVDHLRNRHRSSGGSSQKSGGDDGTDVSEQSETSK